MNSVVKYPVRLLSLLLLMIASIYWLVLVLVCHPMTSFHITRQNHARVRRIYARSCRIGYAVFKLWGLRISSNHRLSRLPTDRPIVLVASHHSSLDMCFLLGLLEDAFGERNLRFVARPGLDRGIPTISYYIKQYCYSLSRAGVFKARHLKEDKLLMADFSKRMNQENGVLTIFPEGVKPRHLKEHSRPFITQGLRVILENMPDAVVVPLVIKGSGEFYSTPRKWRQLLRGVPRFGVSVKVALLSPLEPSDYTDNAALIQHCEELMHREYLRLQHEPLRLTYDAALDSDCEEVC